MDNINEWECPYHHCDLEEDEDGNWCCPECDFWMPPGGIE